MVVIGKSKSRDNLVIGEASLVYDNQAGKSEV